MTIHEASRTLLKSPPELWTECSDATSLSRHLDSFGEIRITRLEPETAVAWEGDQVSGTVKLEPSGWGTRVILTAEEVDPVVVTEPDPEPAAEAELVARADLEPPIEQPAALEEPVIAADPAPLAAEEPVPHYTPAESQPTPDPELTPELGFFARLLGRKRKLSWPQVEPVAEAHPTEPETVVEPVAVVEEEPVVAQAPAVVTEPEPERAPPPEPEPEPEPEHAPALAASAADPKPNADATLNALTCALESLGMAHHRPFSRS